MIKLKSYAKINLALEVKDIIDGYHQVNNIMVPIDLYDELTFEKSNKIELINNEIENNIILKAANLIINKYNINSGVKININKKIPIAAGLAGGSSNAATTLIGINKLYDLNLSINELKSLAEELGSDVPFFINNKLAYCYNHGEKIKELNIDYNKVNILLLIPNINIENKTRMVYSNYVYNGISKEDKINNVIEALKTNNLELLESNIFNDLTEAALKTNNELNNIYNELRKNYDVHLSGAGPAMFIVNSNEKYITLDEYISNADLSMYNSKRSGKNKITIFEESLKSAASNKQEITLILEDAIKSIHANDVYVIDIAKRDENMQAFIFGAVMQAVTKLKLGEFDEDLSLEERAKIPDKIVIFVDELNKYASSDAPKTSPILRLFP